MQLTEKIKDYIANRGVERLEKFDKDSNKTKLALEGDALADYEINLPAKRLAEEQRFLPSNWLTGAALRAKQISLVTHALKYTHSDAKGSSILVTASLASDYLTSRSVTGLEADVVGNAAALDVANLLLLKAEDKHLLDFIAEQISAPLDALGTEQQVKEWMQGFSKALENTAPTSHSLAKQLYFPIASSATEQNYHLLAPLSATSLHQKIYQRIQFHRFSEEAKQLRDLKRKTLYSNQSTRDFLNLAVQTFGGTKPQNISLLNSKRGGKLYLFNTQPPSWKVQLKPPASSVQFWKGYRYKIKGLVKGLQKFLEYASQRNMNNLDVRNKRSAFITQMVDELHNYAAGFWQLAPDWSADSTIKLSLAERCWLDPKATDEAVILEKSNNDWQKIIAKTFAQVLAQELTTEKLLMADDENTYFAKQINSEAKQLVMDLEVME